MLLNREFKLPHVVAFYGYDVSLLPRSSKWRRRYVQLFSEADVFLVLGPHMKKCLLDLGCDEEKIKVRHLGVNLTKLPAKNIQKADRRKVRILIASSFVEKKGIPYAVAAFAEVKKRYPAVELVIIGDGKMKGEIFSLVKELELVNDVKFLGYIDHERCLQEIVASDIFLSPSIVAGNGDTEGTPVILMEAQALGVPVVSTFHADIPEVVKDGVTGFLSPERDVISIADNLSKFVASFELRNKFGKAGRKYVENNFNLLNQTKQLENIYNSLLYE